MECSVGDCDKPAKRGGFCWTHTKRLQRNDTVALRAPEKANRYESQDETVGEAWIAIQGALAGGDREALRRMWDRFRKALGRWKERVRPDSVHKSPEDSG